MKVVSAKKFEPHFREEIAAVFTTLGDGLDFTQCMACGLCSAACPFNDVHPDMDPRRFLRKVLLGMKEEALNDPFLWNCTMCGRCTMLCPMKVDIAGIVRTIRGNFGLKAPGHIQAVSDLHMTTGNQQGVSKEDYLDTLEWMEEELRAEDGCSRATIPVDRAGADILYVINSREAKYYPQDIMNVAKVFYAAGANWTMSSEGWDATNMGLFNGRDDDSSKTVGMVAAAMERLQCRTLVVTECGHAMRSQGWGGRVWLDRKYPVQSIVQVILGYLKGGKLKVRPNFLTGKFTYHDPCNLARKEGVIEEPREVIRILGLDLVEMWPNREYNLCCGGGGGALSMENDRGLRNVRLAKGQLKAEQIRRTGAGKLIVPCHNCFDQLTDLNKHFRLGIKIVHITTLVAEALVLENDGGGDEADGK